MWYSTVGLYVLCGYGKRPRLNTELDFQSLFGLLCTAVLIGWDPATPLLLSHLGSYTRTLLVVSHDRRHFCVTPNVLRSIYKWISEYLWRLNSQQIVDCYGNWTPVCFYNRYCINVLSNLWIPLVYPYPRRGGGVRYTPITFSAHVGHCRIQFSTVHLSSLV